MARAAWLDDPVLALHGRSALAAERAAEAVRAACESEPLPTVPHAEAVLAAAEDLVRRAKAQEQTAPVPPEIAAKITGALGGVA